MINKFLTWFGRSDFWWFVSKNIVAKVSFGKPTFPWRRELPKILETIRRNDEPNAIFVFTLCHTKSLPAILIRLFDSRWTHAGFIYPIGTVKEMTANDFKERPLEEIIKETDYFAVIKYSIKDLDSFDLFVNTKMRQGKYDFSQELDNGAMFYCSEAVYLGLQAGGLQGLTPHMSWGRNVFSPDDVFNQGQIVYCYEKANRG